MNYGAVLKKYIQAGNPSCSPQLLEALAKSKVDRIRLRVAENPGTPKEVLEFLSKDKNADVRVAVGINPSTPSHISNSLASDEDLNVRFGLAEDICCPAELLDKLSHDSNPYISCRARQTKLLLLAEGRPGNVDCHRLFRWVTESEQSGLRYA
jgi:hypothetical protein